MLQTRFKSKKVKKQKKKQRKTERKKKQKYKQINSEMADRNKLFVENCGFAGCRDVWLFSDTFDLRFFHYFSVLVSISLLYLWKILNNNNNNTNRNKM